MVETASLEYCKKLSVLLEKKRSSFPAERQSLSVLPDTKTEYVWFVSCDNPLSYDVLESSQVNVYQEIEVVCPAWQIHELLQELPESIRMSKGKPTDDWYWYVENGISDYMIDVRLVDALIKLAIWRKENEC